MRSLGEKLSAQRLLQILTQLQKTAAELPRSANRRTDAELCLVRLSDESLDESFVGLSARIARMEERLAQGVSAAPAVEPVKMPPPEEKASSATEMPPWEEERPPLPDEPPEETGYVFDVPEVKDQREAVVSSSALPETAAAVQQVSSSDSSFWASFAAGLRGKVPPTVMPYLNNPAKVTGTWKNGQLTLWADSEFTRSILNKSAVLEKLALAAEHFFHQQAQVSVAVGAPPKAGGSTAAAEKDPLDDLISFGGLDNITIQ